MLADMHGHRGFHGRFHSGIDRHNSRGTDRTNRLSVRETATQYLTPVPGLAVDIMKPESRCTYDFVRLESHSPCRWD